MNTNHTPHQPVTVTRRIAGHDITLTRGTWYIATRPMANGRRTTYPVHIRDAADQIIHTIPDLTYDAANRLINAFNDGRTSWDGRTW